MLLQLARPVLAMAVVPFALFIALALVGVGSATTDASPAQLYTTAAIYLGFSLGCVTYGVRGGQTWLAWLLIFAAALPPVLLLTLIMGG